MDRTNSIGHLTTCIPIGDVPIPPGFHRFESQRFGTAKICNFLLVQVSLPDAKQTAKDVVPPTWSHVGALFRDISS